MLILKDKNELDIEKMIEPFNLDEEKAEIIRKLLEEFIEELYQE